ALGRQGSRRPCCSRAGGGVDSREQQGRRDPCLPTKRKFLPHSPALSRTFKPMLRDRIIDQYGEGCRIQQVRRTPRFASALFVVDFMHGARLTRILGAIGRDGQLTEQSGMDLLQPERLVFTYERLMLLAFAVV